MNKNIRFLSSMLVLCGLDIVGVHAAPSVRMLGTNTARIGTNATVVKSDAKADPSTQRLGSIRSKSVDAGAPVTVNKVLAPSVATQSGTTNSGTEARLSLGKYIHSTGTSVGTIKPVTNAEVSSNDFIALSDQVRNLKDTKQDMISAGDGLMLDSNTISLDSTAVQTQVEDALAAYYTKDEVDTKVANVVAGDTGEALSGKQDKIDDLADIRSGAAAGATAVQPATLSSYALKTNVPTKTSELTNDSGFLTAHQDISGKADKATTLAGYGIADAYTKGEVDTKVANIIAGDVSEALAGKADKADVPTKTSELTNDSGFLTAHQDISGKQDKITDLETIRLGAAAGATALQADALTGYAKTADLDSYAKTTDIPSVPTKVSSFANDANYITDAALSGYAKTADLGSYAKTTDIPSVPTNVSSFANDANYITDAALTGYAKTTDIPSVPTNVSSFANDANYITDAALSGLISNPTLPLWSGDYLLKVNLSDGGTYTYSWAKASDYAGGGSDSGSGGSNDDCDPNWEVCD